MYEDTAFLENAALPIIMVCLMALVALVISLIWAVIFCRICAKAGYHWAVGLLILVPIANFVLPLFLAFADWPAQRELRELRQRAGVAPGQDAYRR